MQPPYGGKLPTAIDSRGSIRSGSSVGFGRSVSNRHEQQRGEFLPMGEGEKTYGKERKINLESDGRSNKTTGKN